VIELAILKTKVDHDSSGHGVRPGASGPVTVGDEPSGSMAVELSA